MVGLYAGVSQLARESGSYPECHWFESDRRYHTKSCSFLELHDFFLPKTYIIRPVFRFLISQLSIAVRDAETETVAILTVTIAKADVTLIPPIAFNVEE